MTLQEIKQAVNNGVNVYWLNLKSSVVEDKGAFYVNIYNEELEELEELYRENSQAFYTLTVK